MNVFESKESILQSYRNYVSGFLNIKEKIANSFLENKILQGGALWPSSLISANPSYETGGSIDELIKQGLLHPETRNIFQKDGKPFELHWHQRLAVENYIKNRNTIVTSGTGSGKSLTYFLPIVDSILKSNDFSPGIRAIIVYPMNALINSQFLEFSKFLSNTKVKLKTYTGMTKIQEREEIITEPPHIILTNYVMLEYLMVRSKESNAFFQNKGSKISWIVFDELHTYRGRQGSDVAVLIRKLREKIDAKPKFSGTSATMSSSLIESVRKREIADFGLKMFGVEFDESDIIEEKLVRVFDKNNVSLDTIKKAIIADSYPSNSEEYRQFELANWVEQNFSVKFDELIGSVRRAKPISIEEGARLLSNSIGLSIENCEDAIRKTFLLGNQFENRQGRKFFEFKLHQFFSQGGSIYSTLHPPDERDYRIEGELISPKYKGKTLLLPLAFCRICGAEYYVVNFVLNEERIQRREFLEDPYRESDLTDDVTESGYLFPNYDDSFKIVPENIPDNWISDKKQAIKKEYKNQLQSLFVSPTGEVSHQKKDGFFSMVFQKNPLLICTSCGEVYDRRTSEYRKLATLSSEGRSSATTVLSLATLQTLYQSNNSLSEIQKKNRTKILSFTDNRQDASLQAGHFNDFVRVSLLRAALYSALSYKKQISIDDIASSVFNFSNLELNAYLNNDLKKESPPQTTIDRANMALKNLMYHRLLEDLQRGWRFTQPNLEQLGLMSIHYDALNFLPKEISGQLRDFLLKNQVSEEDFLSTVSVILDEMRKNNAIYDPVFSEEERNKIRSTASTFISDEWRLEDSRGLPTPIVYTISSVSDESYARTLSGKSSIGKFIKNSFSRWSGREISNDEYTDYIAEILNKLQALAILKPASTAIKKNDGYQLNSKSFIWVLGDGKPKRDPIRSKSVSAEIYEKVEIEGNLFFKNLYKDFFKQKGFFKAAEHTGQIQSEERTNREALFRDGELSALYCSPTMELGVDISDLDVVHMRNVPPGPANYAQRSGRAGRAGQSALVMTYCAQNVGHDQYYFSRQHEMVAGVVRTPNMDLKNKDLLITHFHSLWLEKTGIQFSNEAIGQSLDLNDPSMPIKSELLQKIYLSSESIQALFESAKRILDSLHLGKEIFSESELEGIFTKAPNEFSKAFHSVREIIRNAKSMISTSRKKIDQLTNTGGKENQKKLKFWKRLENRAISQLGLVNGTSSFNQDFYPYRYLASVGFLPGYNFPAQPIRAWIPKQKGDTLEGEFIDRVKYLALSEFGPNNLIYHNGSKYRISKIDLNFSSDTIDYSFLDARKICTVCGFVHIQIESINSNCLNCKTKLELDNSEQNDKLLELSTVQGDIVERIHSEEESRRRLGFNITTHFRFKMHGEEPIKSDTLSYSNVDTPVLSLTYGESAEIYSINRGWKKASEGKVGFTLQVPSGRFKRENVEEGESEEDSDLEIEQEGSVDRVQTFVRESSNLLFLRPKLEKIPDNFLVNLMYALAKGMQTVFQIEERELGLELIGTNDHERIMFWEESEGSLGILNQLVEVDKQISQVAKKTLEILHFDPETLEDMKPECVCACYDCLMSYYNQIQHPVLNRHLVKDYLLKLTSSVTQAVEIRKDYNSMHQKFRESIEANGMPISALIFLDMLYLDKRKLPNRMKFPLSGRFADFYFASNTILICKENLTESEISNWNDIADNFGYVVLFIPESNDQNEIYDFIISNQKFFPFEDSE